MQFVHEMHISNKILRASRDVHLELCVFEQHVGAAGKAAADDGQKTADRDAGRRRLLGRLQHGGECAIHNGAVDDVHGRVKWEMGVASRADLLGTGQK